jgi:hypothetical protein
MKSMKRALLLVPALLLLALANTAWADDIHMTPSQSNPAAAGTISVDHDHNGNIELKLRVHHLAKPDAIDPAKTHYVVWVQPKDRPPEPLGVVKVDKDLNGEFRAVTPYQNFDVFITAENTPRPEQPSGPEVLRGTVTK